jgi:hypothetical protein
MNLTVEDIDQILAITTESENLPRIFTQEEMDSILKNAAPIDDLVNHPKHYTFGKYEVIDVLEDWGLDFCLANAVKYIARAGKKDPDKKIQDLEKAIFYINYRIKKLREVHA